MVQHRVSVWLCMTYVYSELFGERCKGYHAHVHQQTCIHLALHAIICSFVYALFQAGLCLCFTRQVGGKAARVWVTWPVLQEAMSDSGGIFWGLEMNRIVTICLSARGGVVWLVCSSTTRTKSWGACAAYPNCCIVFVQVRLCATYWHSKVCF